MEREQFYTYLKTADALDEDSQEELNKLTKVYPWFQAGWMLYLKNLKNINSNEYPNLLKKVAVTVPDRKNLFRFLNSELPKQKISIEKFKSASTPYELNGDNNSDGGDTLIDRFLSTSPAINRRKNVSNAKEVNPGNKEFVEKSVAESDELITETLASIYFQQKNYEKAEEAYRKLSLKYPEKSVYFASRIKEIELLKNNN